LCFEPDVRLRQHATAYCICISVFALVERKTELQKKIMYHAAEGWSADRVTRVSDRTYAVACFEPDFASAAWYVIVSVFHFCVRKRKNGKQRKEESTALPKAKTLTA